MKPLFQALLMLAENVEKIWNLNHHIQSTQKQENRASHLSLWYRPAQSFPAKNSNVLPMQAQRKRDVKG